MKQKKTEKRSEPISGMTSSIALSASTAAPASAAAPITPMSTTLIRRHAFVALLLTVATVFLVNTHPTVGAAAMISAKECGLNPMHPIQMVSQKSGRPLGHVLSVLKDIDRPSYDVLASRFRQYAACVGIVDTGFFRRRRVIRSSMVIGDDDDSIIDWIHSLQNMIMTSADSATAAREYGDETESFSI